MKLTLSQAAKELGINKATLSRWRKNGLFSATKQSDGSYLLDASELDRIKALQEKKQRRNRSATPKMQRLVTSESNSETKVLETKIEALEEQLNRERETTNDLRQRLDQSEAERRRTIEQLTNILTTQDQEENKKPSQGGIGRVWAALKGKL